MSLNVSDKEFEAVSALPGPARYAHFIKRVADREELWGLANPEGWVLSADDEGRECLPVWPSEAYAARQAVGEWEGTTPRAITLDDWLRTWIPGMERDGKQVAVFPTRAGGEGGDNVVVVDPARLRADLGAELERY